MDFDIDEYEKGVKLPLRKATLCLLLKDNKILLAMKKRGFGAGRWNGCGGKQEEGESIEDTAKRETKEEIGVSPLQITEVAVLTFYFPEIPPEKKWNQQVHVYLAREWEGVPTETEEMKPKWFEVEDIPYESMWKDDIHWLPLVLKNQYVSASFAFGKEDKIVGMKLSSRPI